jgi:hypothetical protein
MKIIKRFLIPVTVGVVISMSLVGCGKKSEKPAVEQSAKETKSTEHPTEHPTEHQQRNIHPIRKHPMIIRLIINKIELSMPDSALSGFR